MQCIIFPDPPPIFIAHPQMYFMTSPLLLFLLVYPSGAYAEEGASAKGE